MNIVALIPARAGSKRIPGKNIKPLAGKPLIQWTIEAAQQSGIFNAMRVCSDDPAMFGFGVDGILQPAPLHRDTCCDIEWVRDALAGFSVEAFAILRPTSPFRTAETIRRAYRQFADTYADSIRAVEPVKQTPWKMWVPTHTGAMVPLLPGGNSDWHFGMLGAALAPLHSSPTQGHPTAWVQNASLEMARTGVVFKHGTISGTNVYPFFTEGWEGFDINTPDDWDRAEAHAQTLLARVP